MPTHFLYIIDILGTISFAVSGAFLAMEKKLDPFGVLVLSFVTAIGGGTLRDMMIGNLPVSWLTNSTAAIVIFSSAVVTMFFGRYLKHLTTTLFLFDALGLGLFTVSKKISASVFVLHLAPSPLVLAAWYGMCC